MKATIVTALLTLAAGFPLAGIAADDHAGHNHSGHSAQAPAAAEAAPIEGLVKKVDKAAGNLTISHGPLPNGMPAMTMVFRLKDATWFDQIKDGSKIRFVPAQINGVMTVVRYEPVK